MNDEAELLYGVIVAELNDVVPRRDPSLPNLYVSITSMDLAQRSELLNKGKGPKWLMNNVTALRKDFSVEPTLSSHAEAKALKKCIIQSLKSSGYTVNRDTDLWTVYVIELDSAATKNPGEGYVYVGETKKTPEERFIEHTNRVSNGKTKLFSSVAANHGRRLRMDLAPTAKLFDKESSKQAEADCAERLRGLGYKVRGGH